MNATLGRMVLMMVLGLGLSPALADNVGPREPTSKPAASNRRDALAALEKKLLGAWHGGPCEGNYTFKDDGTFTLDSFTPGGNILTGTWSIRWDQLPPTLVVTCNTSDFKKRDPKRNEYEYLGKPRELKLMELTSDQFVYQYPEYPGDIRNNRHD